MRLLLVLPSLSLSLSLFLSLSLSLFLSLSLSLHPPGVDWHPHRALIASASRDSTLRLWDPRQVPHLAYLAP
jgi:hypothetical protein